MQRPCTAEAIFPSSFHFPLSLRSQGRIIRAAGLPPLILRPPTDVDVLLLALVRIHLEKEEIMEPKYMTENRYSYIGIWKPPVNLAYQAENPETEFEGWAQSLFNEGQLHLQHEEYILALDK